MPANDPGQILRLPKKHAPNAAPPPDPALGKRLWRAQSLRDAMLAATITIILFCIFWSLLSSLRDRVLPWLTVLLGLLIGLAVRRVGRGLDWRFPLLAAAATLLGALAGNVVVAASFTAGELGTNTFTVLGKVTSLTWPAFFDRVVTAADVIYALTGAAIAAFYANRRLSRQQYAAVRTWRAQKDEPNQATF